jgi:peptide-methionine (S)-S-oxide reductase
MIETKKGHEVATLGGGCFWCLEAVYQEVIGVESVVSGYAGGHVADPDYRHVCSGTTGHAEVVRVTFDPDVVSYADLLRVFFTIHDPTTPNRQGHDTGTQYRSYVMTHSDAQAATVREVMAEIVEAGWYDAPLVTEVEGEGPFYVAEPEHQNYYRTHPDQRYCQAVVAPKVAKWRSTFGARLRRPA